jgi:hypothetical protein
MKINTFEQFLNESVVRFTSNPSHAQLAADGLSLLDQIRVWHWQVTIGDLHKALGDFYDEFSGLNDTLIEAVMGKYGRFSIKGTKSQILVDYDVATFDSAVAQYESLYTNDYRKLFTSDPEICNIIDEIVSEMQKLKYLSTMS